MTGSIYDWTISPDANATNDGDINWAEFQDPATVNNSARRMMGRLAETLSDLAPVRLSTGAANVYTVTAASAPVTASLPDGYIIAFRAHQANTAACTLYVNSFAGAPLRGQSGVTMPNGAIQTGMVVIAYYNKSSNEFLAINTGALAQAWMTAFQSVDITSRLIKVGTVFQWPGASLPGGYLWANGAAVSRTTYSELFTAYGTLYGAGDGSTTFNLPDYRGRGLFGKDDMGGSAAGRITNAGSGITATTLGANGGAETVTLAQANLPNVAPSLTMNAVAGHTHFSFASVSVGTGSINASQQPAATGSFGAAGDYTIGGTATAATVGLTSSSGGHTPSGTVGSINGNVTQTAVTNMPPAITCNFIILALPSAAASQILAKGTLTVANGLNSNITLPSQESVRLSGPSGAFSLGGITAGVDGQKLRVYNSTSQAMTIVNEDASSTAANRFTTLTGANVTLRTGTSYASFEYDGTDTRWILTSTN